MDDPKWLAFYGMLQVNAHIVERVGAAHGARDRAAAGLVRGARADLHKGPLRMGELAESLTLSRGGATRLIARMEEDGLVEREIPKEDRRATYARITDKGAEALRTREAGALRGRRGALQPATSTDEQAAVLRAVFARVLLRQRDRLRARHRRVPEAQ